MKNESNQIQTKNWSGLARRAFAEPFLVIGMAVFWAFALPVAATFFGIVAAFEPVFAHLRGNRRAPALMTRRAA